MTDEWGRRSNSSLDVFEVPLVGEPPSNSGAVPGRTGRQPATNWRRVIGVSLVLGTTLGIATSVFIVTNDTEERAAPITAPDDAATVVTTPPTLVGLDELPRPDDPASIGEQIDASPRPASSQVTAVSDLVAVPTYPTYPALPDTPLSDVVRYSVATAIDRHAEDSARRSTTHMELGVGGFALDVVIVRDPVHDRYQLEFETQTFTQTAIVDPATNSTYIESSDGAVDVVLNREIMAGTDAETIHEFVDRLLQGPVRPDTVDVANLRERSLVTIDGVGTARQFVVDIAGAVIPEWQLYVFGPTAEFSPADRPDDLEYSVYVTEDGRIAQVDGVSYLGDVAQLITHRIEVLAEPIVIELPELDARTGTAIAPTTE